MNVRLGEYEIDSDRPIGEGAMGVVYLGRQTKSGSVAAVKMLRPGLSDGEENRARFFREARILSEIQDPHLVPVYASGDYQGRPWLAMEYVDGAGLNRLLASIPPASLPIGIAAELALHTARGLAAGHARGVVHRDVKPGNILVNKEGRAKVMDLGVAQWAEEASLTQTGESHGTPAYMSPEQAAALGQVSTASDVYNLGAVVYQVLTGVPPFVGPTAAVLNGHLNLEPVHPCDRRSDVPEPFGDLVMAFLAKDPAQRPADPVAAIEALGLAAGEEAVRDWMLEVLARRGGDLPTDAPRPASTGATPLRVSPVPVEAPAPRARRRRGGRRGRLSNVFSRWNLFIEGRPLAILGGVAAAGLIVLALVGTVVSRIAALQGAARVSFGRPSASAAAPGEEAREATYDPTNLPPGWTYLGVNEKGFHEVRRPADEAVMIWIEPGEFLMGSPIGRGEDVERPQRRIQMSGYFIDATEVTWARYLAFCRTTGRPAPPRPSWAADDHPVVAVTWEDAAAYAKWAGCKLPTEAQWEKAARGDDGREYPWGDREPAPEAEGIARFTAEGRASRDRRWTAPVGSHPRGASPYGCLDMAGNVWEWCRDWYDPNQYGLAPGEDPEGPESGAARAMRGGSWVLGARHLRAAHRGFAGPEWAAEDLGFRCVLGR